MQKKWQVKAPIDNTLIEELRSSLKVEPIIAELLLQRGITSFEEAQTFFRPKLEDLHDPFLMKDIWIPIKNSNHTLNDVIIQY